MLNVLLKTAWNELRSKASSAETLLGGGPNNSFATAVTEQLQQSGLAQQYPAWAQAASCTLRQATAAAVAGAAGMSQSESHSSINSSSSGAGGSGSSTSGSAVQRLLPNSSSSSCGALPTATAAGGRVASSADTGSNPGATHETTQTPPPVSTLALMRVGRHVLFLSGPLLFFKVFPQTLPEMPEACASLALALLQCVEHRLARQSVETLSAQDYKEHLLTAAAVLSFARDSASWSRHAAPRSSTNNSRSCSRLAWWQ